VLNGADRPVLATQHAEMMVPRSLRHREWVCGIDLSPRSEWVLRFASNAAAAAGATLTAIHAIPTREADGPIQLDLDQNANSRLLRRYTSNSIGLKKPRDVGSKFA
jgi:hypothetical protein